MADAAAKAPLSADVLMPEELEYRELRGWLGWINPVAAVLGSLIVLNQLLNLGFFVGKVMLDTRYLFVLAALFLPIIFLSYPAFRGGQRRPVPWYDLLAAAATMVINLYFAWMADRALSEGWEYAAPKPAIWASGVLCLLILEALRRAGGGIFAFIVLVVAL